MVIGISFHIFSNKTAHWAAIASSRPTGPTPSPVLALKPMLSIVVSSISAIRRRIRSRYGSSLGRWAMTTQSRLHDLPPGPLDGHMRGGVEHFGGIAAAVGLLGIGKHSPDVAQARRRPAYCIGHERAATRRRRCARREPKSCSISTPPSHKRPARERDWCKSVPMPMRIGCVVMSSSFWFFLYLDFVTVYSCGRFRNTLASMISSGCGSGGVLSGSRRCIFDNTSIPLMTRPNDRVACHQGNLWA